MNVETDISSAQQTSLIEPSQNHICFFFFKQRNLIPGVTFRIRFDLDMINE